MRQDVGGGSGGDIHFPRAALWLGAAGVIPFAAGALQLLAGWPLSARMNGPTLFALQIYGAVIVSFVGGIHWGIAALRDRADVWSHYAASVLPSLGAWFAVFALTPAHSLFALAAVIGLFHLYERFVLAADVLPAWLLRLRLGLTLAVAVLLALAGLAVPA